MLNIEIRLYASDNVGGQYNTALSSHEDDAVWLAAKMFDLEYFETLETYLDYVSETVGSAIIKGQYDKDYMSEVFGRIFRVFREQPEKYEKFLESEVRKFYESVKEINIECKYLTSRNIIGHLPLAKA